MVRSYIACNRLHRKNLIERLGLERTIWKTCRLLLLYSVLFGLLMQSMRVEVNFDAHRALHRAYERAFNLVSGGSTGGGGWRVDGAASSSAVITSIGVPDITTVEELKTYLHFASAAARTMQVQSSDHFTEGVAQKILGDLRFFTQPLSLEVAGMNARVSSAAFTFTAWVNIGTSAGGYVLRKPMASTGLDASLSCWGLYVGENTRFDFGAHDYGGIDRGQESVVSSAATVRELHMQTVVVNQTHIAFYVNAELASVASLVRPVTDCMLEPLEVGAPGMSIGEVVFYPTALSQSKIQEIYIGGMTLEAIASGRSLFSPLATDFDSLRSYNTARFNEQDGTIDTEAAQMEMAKVLQAGVMANIQNPRSEPGIDLPDMALSSGCVDPDGWPPCRVIRGVNETLQRDAVTGKEFYDLLPAHAFAGMVEGGRIRMEEGRRRYQYEQASFPRRVGPSWTVSAWIRPSISGSSTYLISKHLSADDGGRCWSVSVASGRLGVAGGAQIDGVEMPDAEIDFGAEIGREFGLTNGRLLRHVAVVADAGRGVVSAYMDGELVGSAAHGELALADIADGYIGLFHRAPGSHDYGGDAQQVRLYAGVALSAEEVAGIHLGAVDPATKRKIRECALPWEGLDASYLDLMGHDCFWFSRALQRNPNICVDNVLRERCPVACNTLQACWAGHAAGVSGGVQAGSRVWDRIMWLAPPPSAHTLCLAHPLDPAQLLAHCTAPPRPSPPVNTAAALATKVTARLLNTSHCPQLQAAIDPLCSFAVPGGWTRGFESAMEGGQGFAIQLWIKAVGAGSLEDGKFRPTMQLLASLDPPQPVVTFHFLRDVLYVELTRHCGWYDDTGLSIPAGGFSLDKWVYLSASYGEALPDGKRRWAVMVDSRLIHEAVDAGWCPSASRHFLQAIAVSHHMLLSPVHIRPTSLFLTQMQREYYAQFEPMLIRTGPSELDATRLKDTVMYTQQPFSQAGYLVAPPLLLQTRVAKTTDCHAKFAGRAILSLWHAVTEGSTCAAPYECSGRLRASPLALLSCSERAAKEVFFGREKQSVRGAEVFAEFLSSITAASMLARAGEVFTTEGFLDRQTEAVQLLLVLVSGDSGIVTVVDVSATVRERARAKFTVRHLQTVEGEVLELFQRYALALFVGCAILILDATLQIFSKHADRQTRVVAGGEMAVAAGIVVLVALRWAFNASSGARMSGIVGKGGLLGVPWAADDVGYTAKVERFFASMDELTLQMERHDALELGGFFLSMLLLVRIIVVVSAHPRVSLLVATVVKGADDFLHFFLLFAIIFCCFALIALLRFAPYHESFSSFGSTLVVLLDLTLGALPAGFEKDWMLAVFVLCFLAACFFLMLNFLLAIIVESYMGVKQDIITMETEQDLLSDIASSLFILLKRTYLRWPSARNIEAELARHTAKFTAGLDTLALVDPTWSRTSRLAFIRHYKGYAFLAPKPLPESIRSLDHAVGNIEGRLALLVNKPVPSTGERVMHLARRRKHSTFAEHPA